jgi:geranylgeranyl reductase family protein
MPSGPVSTGRETSLSKNHFDVIVVGGGPAGSTAAYFLASAGVDVAILDRATFPRDKSCGGGLQAKVPFHLPLDVTPVVRNSLYGICFSHQFGDRFTNRYHEPVVYGTLRREFDSYLIEQAVRRGARLFERTRVAGFLQQGERKVELSTDAGGFSCQVLIGADGANGVVRRALNSELAFFNQAGLSFEIERDRIIEDRVDHQIMRVDWGTLPSGYAWIFPKGDFLNIGAGTPVAFSKRLKPYLCDFLRHERILKTERIELGALHVSGHKLPSWTERTRLVDQNVLVIGDAAGLIEPLTGDGISYGVQSARLAADVVTRWLTGGGASLSEYREAVQREIVPELVSSRTLMTVLNAFPRMAHEVLRRNERIWQILSRILTGEESYESVRSMYVGHFNTLSKYLERFTRFYETRRLRDPKESETLFQRAVRLTFGPILERV